MEGGNGLAFGKWVGACVFPGIFAGRAFKIHMVPETFEGVGNPGDVDGFCADPASPEAVENVHGNLCKGFLLDVRRGVGRVWTA